MKQMIKAIAMLAAAAMLSGCGQAVIGEKQAFNPNVTVGESDVFEEEKKPVDTLKVPGSYDSITASPWNCPDLDSRKAATLIYDQPIKLSSEFKAEPSLVTVSGSGTEWTLTVRDGVVFSDGTALTAQDIDNSLSLAMAEGSYYQRQLANISSHNAVDEKTVAVTLSSPDALFANLLTFPVARSDGAGYIGTGRYVPDNSNGGNTVLKRNPSYFGEAASIEKIELVSLNKKDVATYSLKLGEIDCLYSEGSLGDISNLSTGNYPVVSNRLVFIGANGTKGNTASSLVRRAISSAIDRQYLVQTALSASAVPSASVLHPNFAQFEGTKVEKSDIETAQKLLTEAGAADMELSLLYCADSSDRAQTANQIAAQLAQAGITVNLDAKGEADYFAALDSGAYDLYLGEIVLGDDMNLSHILTRGERYGYGAAPSEALMTAYGNAFAAGSGWEEFTAVFAQEYPVIPLAFRHGIFSFSREYSLAVNAVASDLFYNIEDWQQR